LGVVVMMDRSIGEHITSVSSWLEPARRVHSPNLSR